MKPYQCVEKCSYHFVHIKHSHDNTMMIHPSRKRRNDELNLWFAVLVDGSKKITILSAAISDNVM